MSEPLLVGGWWETKGVLRFGVQALIIRRGEGFLPRKLVTGAVSQFTLLGFFTPIHRVGVVLY